MVGIGGGVPSQGDDIRLGHIVVSKPATTFRGVIQYDLGKTVQHDRFEGGCLSEQTTERTTGRSLQLSGETNEGRLQV